MKKHKIFKEIEIGIIITSLVILTIFIILMCINPVQTLNVIEFFFNKIITILGPFFQLIFFITFLFAIYLCFSKYGNIKMGDDKPEYSMFSYINMMIMASLASAALYWSFTEWAHYYKDPGLNIPPFSTESLEASIGYQFFHWGIINQSVYTIVGVALSYGFYVKKIDSFQTSALFCNMLGNSIKSKKAIGKIID